MSLGHYVLGGPEGHTPIRCDSLAVWARRFNEETRRVAKTELETVWISTVFLGLDHQYGKGPPLLFETMVLRNESEILELMGKMFKVHEEDHSTRYATWDDAVAGHDALVRRYQKLEEEAKLQLAAIR